MSEEMNPYAEQFRKLTEAIAKDLIDRGLLIRAGCKVLLSLKLPEDRDEALRYAFFAGAEHLFSSIMQVLDPGEQPTEKDEQRMSAIHGELEKWRKTAYALLESSPRGHA